MANSRINPIRQTTPEEEAALRRLTMPDPMAGLAAAAPNFVATGPTNQGPARQASPYAVQRPAFNSYNYAPPQKTEGMRANTKVVIPQAPVTPAKPTADLTAPGQRQLRTPFEQRVVSAPVTTPQPAPVTQPITVPPTRGDMTHTRPRGEGVPVNPTPAMMFPGSWPAEKQPLQVRQAPPSVVARQPAAPSVPPAPAVPPAAPGLNVPYSPVGPNQVQQDIGRPLPPPGMVEVIRPGRAGGFNITNEGDGLSIPAGLDSATGTMVAGLKNAGLSPPEQIEGVRIIRGAENDARQAEAQMLSAQAAQTSAQAAMLNAQTPDNMTQGFIPDPNDPHKGRLSLIYMDPKTGQPVIKETPITQYKDLDDKYGLVTYESPTGEKKQAWVEKATGRSGEFSEPGKNKLPPMPEDIDPSWGPYWDEAVETAIKEGYDANEAAIIAAKTMKGKRAPAQTVE